MLSVGHVVTGVVEQSGVSLSLSFWLGLSLSLSNVDSSDRVGQISATGSIPVGLVGSNSGGGDIAGLVAGVAVVGGVAAGGQGGSEGSHGSGVVIGGVAGLVEALLAVGPVEQGGVSLGLSCSQGSATDLRGE